MDNSVIARSGWLLKKGDDLRWNKKWVELYRDGYFKFYESHHSPNAEDTIFMPTECSLIRTGCQVDVSLDSSVLPPKYSNLCLFSVATTNKVWIFCANSLDDMRSWQLALEQARLLVVNQRLGNRSCGSLYSASLTTTPGIYPFTPYLTQYSAVQSNIPVFGTDYSSYAHLLSQPRTSYEQNSMASPSTVANSSHCHPQIQTYPLPILSQLPTSSPTTDVSSLYHPTAVTPGISPLIWTSPYFWW